MIKRSVPVTLSIFCEDISYAEGVKDGVTHALESLLHECDVIMRVSPYVIQLTTREPDSDELRNYQVRARFTVREKRQKHGRGVWIKTDRAFYEEEMNDQFDTSKEWVGLTDDERDEIYNRHSAWVHAVEAKLKEKNHG